MQGATATVAPPPAAGVCRNGPLLTKPASGLALFHQVPEFFEMTVVHPTSDIHHPAVVNGASVAPPPPPPAGGAALRGAASTARPCGHASANSQS